MKSQSRISQRSLNQRSSMTTMMLVTAAVVIFLAALTFINVRYARNSPGGNDFLVHWMGTRSLVTQGLNPYSDEVAEKIQVFAYGHKAGPGEHELRVAYPLYSVIVFLPFAMVENYDMARALWMTTLEVGLVLLTFLSIRLAKWRVGPLMLALLLVYSLLWYHGLRPLINGNAVVLVALGLVGGFLAIRNNADELAGVLFAFTTIKPQVVVLVLVFVVFWAMNQNRWKLVGWLLGTVFLLAASAALIIPTWPLDNLREVLRYPSYNPPGSPQAAFKIWWPWGERLGWALTAVMGLTILVEWWNNRNAEFRGFLWTACLTLAAGQWTGIMTDPGNYVVLFPALVLVFALLDERWRTGGRLFVILSLVALFAGIWVLFLRTVSQVMGQPQQSSLMYFPLPAFLLLTLYWVRWWAVEPPTMWFEQIDR